MLLVMYMRSEPAAELEYQRIFDLGCTAVLLRMHVKRGAGPPFDRVLKNRGSVH